MTRRSHFQSFNQTVWAMLVGGFLVRVTYFMSWPFLIVLLNQKLGTSPTAVGVILGVSVGISSLLGLYIGYLSDKFGRKPLMLIGCLIMAMAFLSLNISNNFWHFFMAMALMGLGTPALETSTKAIISESLDDNKAREFALHLRYFLINVAGAIGALVGIAIGLKNPAALFIGTAVTYVGYFIWIFKLIKPIKNLSKNCLPNFKETIKIIRQDFLFLLLLIADFLVLVVYSQFNSALPQIITLNLAEKATQLIVLLTVVNCATVMIFQFPLLKLLNKFNVNVRSQIGLILMLISQVLFIVIDKHSALAWGIVFFILSLGEAIVFPTINVYIDQMAKPKLRGSYFGASNLSGFGTSAGAMIGGAVIGAFGDMAYFVLTTLICAVCLGLYQRLYHRQALV